MWNILGGFAVRGKDPDASAYINFLLGVNFATVGGILSEIGYGDALAFEINPGVGIVVGTVHIRINYLSSKPYFKNSKNSNFNAHQEMDIVQLAAGVEF